MGTLSIVLVDPSGQRAAPRLGVAIVLAVSPLPLERRAFGRRLEVRLLHQALNPLGIDVAVVAAEVECDVRGAAAGAAFRADARLVGREGDALGACLARQDTRRDCPPKFPQPPSRACVRPHLELQHGHGTRVQEVKR